MEQDKPIRGSWRDDPAHFERRPSRREFLYVGLLGGLGITLGDFFGLEEAQAKAKFYKSVVGPAKSAIHIFLPGGISAQESWDPKPYAPIDYRGPFGTVKTKLSGVRFSEHLKQTAQIADKLTIIRSMTHGAAAHKRGTHNMFTGYPPSTVVDYPSYGSVVSHEFGPRKNLPPYICIPNKPNPFAGSGYLSSAYGPFSLGSDPASKNFSVRDLSLPPGVSRKQFGRRRSILNTVDQHFASLEYSDKLDAMDSFYQRAYGLISSKHARQAFDISAEDPELRDRYGRNRPGQRMLMARRLVEAGVRFVSLTYGGWDNHRALADRMSDKLPPFDQAFSTLIRDLEDRGMLDSTLVIVSSEFGRTPKINKDAGRDHWPNVFSVAMAGGGIKKGCVYGQTDPMATAPAKNAVTVPDFATTIYNQLGIVADKELISPGGRPVEIVKGGKVIKDVVEG